MQKQSEKMLEFSWKELSAMVPRSVKAIELIFMVGVLIYQSNLVWQVARDFIAVNNTILAGGFTAMIICLILGVDFMVFSGIVSPLNNTKWTMSLFGVIGVVLVSVFILEIGRLNVAQNGIPLASQITTEFAKTIDQGIREVENTMNKKVNQWTSDIALLEAATDAESKGLIRKDIERDLRDRFNIDFKFTGLVGTSSQFQTTRNIKLQKEQEYSDFERYSKKDRETMSSIRTEMVRMASTNLTPENYTAFVEEQAKISSQLKELAVRYQVDPSRFEIKPAESLFVIAIKSAFSFSMTSLVLWLLALGTGFGGFLLALFINAIVISYNLAHSEHKKSIVTEARQEAVNIVTEATKKAEAMIAKAEVDVADLAERQKRATEETEKRLRDIDLEIEFIRKDAETNKEQATRQYERASRTLEETRKQAQKIVDDAHAEAQKILALARDKVYKI